MASVASQLIEEVTAHAQNDSLAVGGPFNCLKHV